LRVSFRFCELIVFFDVLKYAQITSRWMGSVIAADSSGFSVTYLESRLPASSARRQPPARSGPMPNE